MNSPQHPAQPHPAGTHQQQPEFSHGGRMYLRFGAMILTSTTVMFLLTYTNVFRAADIRWSQERLYMALLMGSAMAVIMLLFMWSTMYRDVRRNLGILTFSIALAAGSLLMSRQQVAIGDRLYMDGMIPHHSIAILTSERATITDVRVAELARGISQTQRKEIKEMTWLVDDISQRGPATSASDAQARPVPDFSGNP